MNVQRYFAFYCDQLSSVYEKREAENIAHLVFEQFTGLSRLGRILQKEDELDKAATEKLDRALKELLQYRPVQYVIGEAWFYKLKLKVNEQVLIPRPETEELVEWMINSAVSSGLAGSSILDIGTGSGCIAVALKKNLPSFRVSAIDISEQALAVAKENAALYNEEIDFLRMDILKSQQTAALPSFDIMVSNPPYVKQSEKNTMRKNVLDYEPHSALFVPDEDALKFYRAIVIVAKEKLNPGGRLFFEINESLGETVAGLLREKGFAGIELRKDLSGKDRMVRAVLNPGKQEGRLSCPLPPFTTGWDAP